MFIVLSMISFGIGIFLFAIFTVIIISKRNTPLKDGDIRFWIFIFSIAACFMLAGIGIKVILA